MRVLFAGTPATAVPSLRALLESRHEVVGVLTRPDARAGRGRRLVASPVKDLANEAALPVLQPRTLKTAEAHDQIAKLGAEIAAVVAYGALLPPDVLAIPPRGWINLHFSLLPAWRGAAPAQYSIWSGDDVGGASVFQIEEGLDTGPILARMTEAIRPTDTSGTLLARLADAGAGLLVRTLDAIEAGILTPEPQPADGVTLAPRIKVADAEVDWRLAAWRIDRHVRAMTPDPGAWTTWRGERLKIGPVTIVPEVELPPGLLQVTKHEVLVGAGQDAVRLGEVAPAGKGWMAAESWARGARPQDGERFGGEEDHA